MCMFITITLPDKIKTEKLTDVVSKYGMSFERKTKEFAEIKPNDSCYSPFRRRCDCETVLGLSKRSKSKKEEFKEGEAPKMWLDFFNDILSNEEVFRIGVILHWAANPYELKRTERIDIKYLTEEMLLNLEEDVLYEFFKIAEY